LTIEYLENFSMLI